MNSFLAVNEPTHKVKLSVFDRVWVPVWLAFAGGVLLTLLLASVADVLPQHAANGVAGAHAAFRSASGSKWRDQIEAALGKVGSLSANAPPALFPNLTALISDLQKGQVPGGAVATLRHFQAEAKLAVDALDHYDLTGQVRGYGMSEGQASWFLNSQTRIVQALEIYKEATTTSILAIAAPRDRREAIAEIAGKIRIMAAGILRDGWIDYEDALRSVQISGSSPTTATAPAHT